MNNINFPDPEDFEIDINFGLSNKYVKQDINDIIDISKLENNNQNHISKNDENYLDNIIKNDIIIFNEFSEFIKKDTEMNKEINNLEDYRVLRRNILVDRGVFYCENIVELFNKFDRFKQSSLLRNDNRAFTGRYMLPIKLLNGDIYTYLGYNPYPTQIETRYEMPNLKWINQYNLIGNLESINLYEGNLIYVTEGYFDALTLNSQWGVKSVCIFGSRLSTKQRSIMNILKGMGHALVYVPDNDEAGYKIASDKIWDFVWKIPKYKDKDTKDINDYVSYHYADICKQNNTEDIVRKHNINIDIYKPDDFNLMLSVNSNIQKYKSYAISKG